MIDVIAFGIGALGTLFGLRCYVELWRWARQCQNAKIAIANKGRVQLQAPLTEWLAWANQLTQGQERGRVVYKNAKVSVAILRAPKASRIRSGIGRVRGARRHRKGPQQSASTPAQQK